MSGLLTPSGPEPGLDLPLSTAGPQDGSDGLWIWGVDGSTKRVAVGFAREEVVVESVEFRAGLFEGARLAEIRRTTRTFAAAWARLFPPHIAFVEQPSGRSASPQLVYAIGVIQEALYDALEFVHQHPVEVRTIPSSRWKEIATGSGWSPKPKTLRWARNAHGYEGTCLCLELGEKNCKRGTPAHDEADAIGIAVAGRRLLEPKPEQLELAS